MNFKKKLEYRAEEACYLRKICTDLYQIWMPASKTITSVRISDFILQQVPPSKPVELCNNDEEPDDTHANDDGPANEVDGNQDDDESLRSKPVVSFEDSDDEISRESTQRKPKKKAVKKTT